MLDREWNHLKEVWMKWLELSDEGSSAQVEMDSLLDLLSSMPNFISDLREIPSYTGLDTPFISVKRQTSSV